MRIDHQFTSTISLRSVRGMLLDTLAIFYRRHVLGCYDQPAETPSPAEPAAVSV